MRKLILYLMLCSAVVSAFTTAHARIVTRVVSETNGELVLEFESFGPAVNPIAKIFVAIPAEGNYSVALNTGTVVRWTEPPMFSGGESPDSVRARLSAADTVRVAAPVPFRGVRLLNIEFDLVKFPSGTTDVLQLVKPSLRITYDPAPVTRNAQATDVLLRGLVENEDVFPGTDRSGATDPFFSRAATWLKIPVERRGVFVITGGDLEQRGVSLQTINDPASFRLFSSLGLEQPRGYGDPAGSWMAGNAMEEVAIVVEDGGDGTFDVNDRIVFYGVAASDWADLYDPGAPDTEYTTRPRTDTNYYYLTWDGQFAGSPRRVTQAAGPPGSSGDVDTYVARYWGEQDLIHNFEYGDDGWLWHEIRRSSGFKNAALTSVRFSNVDTSRPQTFRTLGLAPYDSPSVEDGDPANLNDHIARYEVRAGGAYGTIVQAQWTTRPGQRYFEDGTPIRHDGFFLVNNAQHDFRFVIPTGGANPNPQDFGYFAWFSVHYHRFLRASGNALGFPSPDTTGSVTFAVDAFSSVSSPYVFDVTDMRAPVRITGAVGAGTRIRFSSDFNGGKRRFWVSSAAGLRTPAGMELYMSPPDLRAEATGPNMLIISAENLLPAAQRLRAHRLRGIPGYPNPRVKLVTVTEVFDNFSGGMPDAIGLRNYIKFLYDNYTDANGNPSLAYVLFFGDANEDLRGYATSQPDPVPSNVFLSRPYSFVTDEWMGLMDAADQVTGFGVLDVAIGRMPAVTLEEANILVDKLIAYETEPTYGEWRKRIVLVADDEKQSNEFLCDTQFTYESEEISTEQVPEFLEVRKIYLTEYDRISGVKPASRARLLEEWNSGALVINYIGHGSNRSMADEQVFVDSDVTQLENDLRLPILCALSCTIGDFANYQVKSLSERLLLRREGGVIATVTASRETFANLNKPLNYPLIERLSALDRYEEQPAIGHALMMAKAYALFDVNNQLNVELNNWKYNLLCDPSLRLRAPRQEVRFDMAEADSLVAGLRKNVTGAVYRDGAVDTSFDGAVAVLVREPDIDRRYVVDCITSTTLFYRVPGGVLYHGVADVTDGRFEFSFRVPRSASRGPLAFISAYADDGTSDAAATLDSVLSLVAPTAADSAGLRPIDGAPRVTLGFKSGLSTVKPGETLQAVVRDADGINILDTTNEGKQAIVFDDLPVPIDANEFFAFEHGGTDTSGVLLFPLPELEFGEHRAVYKVSDAFGQTTLDTLLFSVTDPRAYTAEVLFNYPNPFTDDTSFLVRLSDRAHIRLDIFTVSGRRIRRLEATRDPGEVWIHWDGRDRHGSEIANGVYLYVATVEFAGVERPPLVLRGNMARIR